MGWLDFLDSNTVPGKQFQDSFWPGAGAAAGPTTVAGLAGSTHTLASYAWEKATKPTPPPPTAWEKAVKTIADILK